MNRIHRLAFFLALCVVNQTLLPIIVTATIMSKEMPNGKKQHVVLLGDRHMFLDYELEFNRKKISTITASERAAVLDWAKKCGALVLVEDLAAIQLGKIKQKILTFIKNRSNCSSFLSELTTHCQEKNIRTVNIETRAHTIVSSSVLVITGIASIYTAAVLRWVSELNYFAAQHKGKLILTGMAPLLVNIPLLYAAYKEHKRCSGEIASHENMVKHIDYVKTTIYKSKGNSLTTWLSGWLVDTKILSTLYAHQDAETIFICAGALHTEATKKFLSEQGYTQESVWENQYAKTTNFVFVDLNQLINLDVFLQTLQA